MSHPERVSCDNVTTCGHWFDGAVKDAESRARVRGWRFFEGYTGIGEKINSVLCPQCVGQRAERRPRLPHLDQEALW